MTTAVVDRPGAPTHAGRASTGGGVVSADGLADHRAIRTLTARYGLAVDTFDLEGVMAVYADDATPRPLRARDAGARGEGGAPGVLRRLDPGHGEPVHLVANHVVDLDGPTPPTGPTTSSPTRTSRTARRSSFTAFTRTPIAVGRPGGRSRHGSLSMLVPPVIETPPADRSRRQRSAALARRRPRREHHGHHIRHRAGRRRAPAPRRHPGLHRDPHPVLPCRRLARRRSSSRRCSPRTRRSTTASSGARAPSSYRS